MKGIKDMIVLILVALVCFIVRGGCEYIVSADLFGGWWLPGWYDKTRSDDIQTRANLPLKPGWYFWRDHWHLFQWLRNQSDIFGSCFLILGLLSFASYVGSGSIPASSYLLIFVVLLAAREVWFYLGHRLSFSLIRRITK